MSLTINDYILSAQSNIRTHIAKIEILEEKKFPFIDKYCINVLDEISEDIISGSITLNNTPIGQRRSATLTLKNDDGKYTPAYRETLWLNKMIKIYSGLKINGEDYFINKGIFVISEVQVNSQFSDKNVIITCVDKFANLDGTIAGTLASPYIIDVNTILKDAVMAVFAEAGEKELPIIEIGDISSTPIAYTIAKEAGDTYSSILSDLANMISWNCFYDKNGIPRFQSPTDEQLAVSSWSFSTDEVTYLGVTHRYKFDSVKNTVVVFGDNINGELFKATSVDENAISPTRVELIGTRVKVITDENIYNDDLAQQRADYELKQAIILQESIDLQAIPIDYLDEGQIITIWDESAGLDKERYLINSISIPLLSGGNMTLNCWKTRDVS